MTSLASDAETTQDLTDSRRFVVRGDDTLAYRLTDELVNRHRGEVTVIMRSKARNYGRRIAKLAGVTVIETDESDEDAFELADLATAEALALVERNDLANIDSALSAHELNPRLRIVVRMFNTSLGEGLAQVPLTTVLSDTAMAAPAFVAAATGEVTPRLRLRGGTMVVTERAEVAADEVLCGLAATADDQGTVELLPAQQETANLVLARTRPARRTSGRRRRRLTHHYPIRAVLGRVWKRLRIVLLVFFALLAVATGVLVSANSQLNWWTAAYEALFVAFGAGSADLNLSTREQVTETVLAFASIGLIPLLTATVVDAVVKSRLDLAEGALTKRASGHVVVAGLGGIGGQVVQTLYDQGIDVVGIDTSADSRGAQLAHDLHVPLIVGDASRKETLLAASVPTARALMAVTPDDGTNLETAIVGRSLQAELPVVLRLFDGDFADRIQRAFNITVSRSVSYLAAPEFAAHMVGHVLDTIPVGRHVLLLADVTVGANSNLENMTVGELRRPRRSWILEVTNVAGQRLPAAGAGRKLSRDEKLLVVATRRGLAELLADAETQESGRRPIVIHDSNPFAPQPRTPSRQEPAPQPTAD